MWSILFEVCRYADEQPKTKNYIQEFTEALRWCLPCSECRSSFTVILSFMPPTAPYTEWVWKIRNIVNKKLQCPLSACITLEQFKNRNKLWKRFATNETVATIVDILLFHFLFHLDKVPKEHLKGLSRFLLLLPIVLPPKVLTEQMRNILFSRDQKYSNYEQYLKNVRWALKTYYQS